jgi:hypothetical protein
MIEFKVTDLCGAKLRHRHMGIECLKCCSDAGQGAVLLLEVPGIEHEKHA